MLIDRQRIAGYIPHAGSMCLLDGVEACDAQRILCLARSHRDAANPLARNGQLHAICAVEYASQAMALHGGLTQPATRRPRIGYLASVREVICHCARLDTHDGPLEIEAQRLAGEDTRVLYAFSVRAGGEVLVEGRAAVVLDAQ